MTDVDAHLMVTNGESGKTSLLGEEGNYLSKHFIAPHQSGKLIISNPSLNAATVTWKNGGISVPSNQTTEIDWPPVNLQNAAVVESSENVFLQWGLNTSGMNLLPAIDTGQITGMKFLGDNSDNFINTTSEFGDYSTMLAINGDSGIIADKERGPGNYSVAMLN